MNDYGPYTFSRYLSSKKSVDDRALNPHVWDSLVRQIQSRQPQADLHVLEVGAGIGTMVERMIERRALAQANYLAIDQVAENIDAANQRLPAWAAANGYRVRNEAGVWKIRNENCSLNVRFERGELFEFAARPGVQKWDLLVANAFLDLFDIPRALPALFSLLKPGGLFYFTINFDGLTLLEPAIDPAFDELIQTLYHRTMDERITGGLPSGDSRAGRHLFGHLRRAGANVMDAGASDWVVFSPPEGYIGDEAYFLHFIIHTIDQALHSNPALEPERFQKWVAMRHAQIESGELVYIAHQLDFLGRWDG